MRSLLRFLFERDAGKVASERPDESGSDVHGHVDRAGELRAQGRLGAALDRLRSLLGERPSDPDAQLALAQTLLTWGRVREAEPLLSQLAAASLADRQSLTLGNLLLAAGRATDAARVLAGVKGADHRAASRLLCVALRSCGRYEEAVRAADAALEDVPGNPALLLAKAMACVALARHGPAADCAREVLRIDPTSSLAHFVLGTAYRETGKFDASAQAFLDAVRGDAPAALPHRGVVDLATALETIGDYTAALEVLRAAIAVDATPEMHRTYGQMLLRAGRFREGWEQYEFRWFMEPMLGSRMRGGLAQWRGESLAGKVILLRIEQGLGDAIQFMRYALSLEALGARVAVGPIELADSYEGVDGVLGRDFSPADIDCYANLLSLPLMFGTTVESIPAPIPYVRVGEARRQSFASAFEGGTGLRVALVWAGNPNHPEDRYRSLPLDAMAPLFRQENVRFFSVQKVLPREEDRQRMRDWGIVDLAEHLGSLADTAAILASVDLLITVDTSLAHLAGALGKPVWLLNAYPGEWRWMGTSGPTPWYPTMRVFRQAVRGEWDAVMQHVAAALSEWTMDASAEPRSLDALRAVAPRMQSLTSFARETGFVINADDVLLQFLPSRDRVGESLEAGRAYLPAIVAALTRLPLSGATAIEACAGVGHHAVRLARMLGEAGHLIAYEPEPRIAAMLRENLQANDVRNASIVVRSLGASSGERADRIDDLGLARLDLVKLGGTTSKLDVLAGAEHSIWQLRPRVVVECSGTDELASIAEWLRNHGYRLWRLQCEASHGGLPDGVAVILGLAEEANEQPGATGAAHEWLPVDR